MAFSSNKRFFLSGLYLGLLFFIGGQLLFRLPYVQGQLLLSKNVTEHLVVAPHGDNNTFWLTQRNVPSDLLLFDSDQALRHLTRDGRYDGVRLASGLRFEGLDIVRQPPDTHLLVMQENGGEEAIPVQSGDSIVIGTTPFTVENILPWEGLLRHANGRPMVTLGLRIGNDDTPNQLFLAADAWAFVASQLAVQFRWHADESHARKSAAESREKVAMEARWGVRDGQAIQWFQGLSPGSGLTLRDGTQITLRRVLPAQQAIELRYQVNDTARMVEVPVNTFGDDWATYYQNPAVSPNVLIVHAWEEAGALLQWIGPDEFKETRFLAQGDRWGVGVDTHVQLENVVSHAVPVTTEAGGLYAVHLRQGEATHVLRQGLINTIGGHRVGYRRVPQAPEGTARLRVVDEAGAIGNSFELAIGSSHRIGSWVYTLEEGSMSNPDYLILKATRRPGGPAFFLGSFLFIAGSYGLLWLRFRAIP